MISAPFPTATTITAADITGAAATIDNIRLWDPTTLLDAYRPLQALRLLLQLHRCGRRSLHDRGQVPAGHAGGPGTRPEQAAGRSPDLGQPPPHLHPRVRRGGQPGERGDHGGSARVLRAGHPAEVSVDLQITQPEIYYGELGNEYVLVKTVAKEFDYPKGQDNVVHHLRRHRRGGHRQSACVRWPSPCASARSSCCCRDYLQPSHASCSAAL